MRSAPYTVTILQLTANIPAEVRGETRFVALLAASVDLTTVEVSIQDGGWQPLLFGVAVVELEKIDRLSIRSSTGQQVRIGTGSAMVYDSRSATIGAAATSITDVGGNGLGQETMANSVPVAIASDQSAVAMKGETADGAAVAGKVPVLIAGQDGTNVQTIKTDTVGRQEVVGQVADGAAVSGAGAPVLIAGQDGTNVQTIKTNTVGHPEVVGPVSAGSAIGTTAPVLTGLSDGTNVQRVRGSTTGAVMVTGEASHSSASIGNPVRVGGRVATAVETTLAAGDAADLQVTSGGAATVFPFAVPDLIWTYAAAASGIVNTTTAVTIKTAAAAGVRNYITSMDVQWEALTNATEFVVRDGASGTVIHRWKIPSGSAGHRTFEFATPLRGTAATLLEVCTLTASGSGAVYVNAQGFTAP